ncbi:immunoglobulin superfamily containing leucine-rich repeat protein 2 [Thalassophryne amazonica]|uniref:immunoglobulin superfamily containing leucine-rich repeat protein 2 n=1 Tax=Thalassophryne amazonica TaxID=390379 RepID=UPI001470ACBB|nr:immunoglobulin superfamily containing leucine-rich repeat protein 2 [Thalassophryne amazonica]XP_034032329.1 immunoglobulin superfamily containing leucine-rich repeat protein 2 [Thalassophryne amazonica]
MTRRLLQLFALWASVVGVVNCCPEPCSCLDKIAVQVADCAYKNLLVVPEGLPPDITTLSLSANKIKFLKSNNFINATRVSSLWLAHNEIVTIEVGTLAPLIQLRNFDISYNKIVNFPWEDLHNLTALQLLKMNNNEMVSLPKDAFSTLKDLRSLRINDNKFTTIVEGTFLPSISHIQIFKNPFKCSCSLEWMRDWITTSKITIPDPNLILCDTPETLKGIMVTKMPKLDCKAPTVTITYQPNIENTEIYEGFMVILNCESKGSPTPQVSWEVNTGNQKFEFPLPASSDNTMPINDKTTSSQFFVFPNGTLIIPRMSKKEDGNYSCSASNDLGKVETSVKVALAGTQKHATNSVLDPTVDKTRSPASKPVGPKMSKNNVINWAKPEEKTKSLPKGSSNKDSITEPVGGVRFNPPLKWCGVTDRSEYIANHAFNGSLDDLKQYTFDFGVIALEVSETDVKVQLNPLQLPSSKLNLHVSHSENVEMVNKELGLDQSSPNAAPMDMLYLCVHTGSGHSVVEWSKIEEGVNAYRFHGLHPGTNYTLCFTYGGQDCQVQVVFTTRKKIPSLLIIVVVSTFLLALATVPLLGATCCHLLYKYQGKTFKLIMKTQNLDQLEKQMAADFDPRASFVESEKHFDPSELGEVEGEPGGEEGEEGEGEADGSVVTESIPGSSSKTNQEDFEAGSEYSDRLPLGAEAVNISEEINGNYKQPSR